MTIDLSPDQETIVFQGQSWSGVYPVSHLDRLIRFYTLLRDRRGGRFAPHYAGTVTRLHAIRKTLEGA